jgi:type I restriction enzyme S subunit
MGKIELPPDWKVVKLGEICKFTSKPRGLKYSNYEKIPFIPMDLVPIGNLYFENFVYQNGLNVNSGTYFERGDLLIAKITPSFENGKQGIINNLPSNFGVATTEVIPIKEIAGLSHKEFLAYYLLRKNIRSGLSQKDEG